MENTCIVSPHAGFVDRSDSKFLATGFDLSEGKVLSWLRLEDDDATTIHTSSDSDELDNSEEIKDGARTRTHHDPDLPLAWCAEAERETPEPEKPLHSKLII